MLLVFLFCFLYNGGGYYHAIKTTPNGSYEGWDRLFHNEYMYIKTDLIVFIGNFIICLTLQWLVIIGVRVNSLVPDNITVRSPDPNDHTYIYILFSVTTELYEKKLYRNDILVSDIRICDFVADRHSIWLPESNFGIYLDEIYWTTQFSEIRYKVWLWWLPSISWHPQKI